MLCRGLLRIKRKEGDSNPRRVAPCLISNQVPSTSRPSFHSFQKLLPGGLEPPRPQRTLVPETSASTKFRHDSNKSGIRESNPHPRLGKPLHDHCANTAKNWSRRDSNPPLSDCEPDDRPDELRPLTFSKGKPPLGAPLITAKENHIMNAKAAIAETEGSLNSPLSASNMLR